MRTVDEGIVVEEIRVLRAPAQLEGHEERLGIESRILLARRDIHVERHGLQVAKEIVPLRQKLRIGRMAVCEQFAARLRNGAVPDSLRFGDGYLLLLHAIILGSFAFAFVSPSLHGLSSQGPGHKNGAHGMEGRFHELT